MWEVGILIPILQMTKRRQATYQQSHSMSKGLGFSTVRYSFVPSSSRYSSSSYNKIIITEYSLCARLCVGQCTMFP